MAMFVRGMFYTGGLGAGYYAMSQMGQPATVAKTEDAAVILKNPSEKPQMLGRSEECYKAIVDKKTAAKYCDVFNYYDASPEGTNLSTDWNYVYRSHGCADCSATTTNQEDVKKCELVKKVLDRRIKYT